MKFRLRGYEREAEDHHLFTTTSLLWETCQRCCLRWPHKLCLGWNGWKVCIFESEVKIADQLINVSNKKLLLGLLFYNCKLVGMKWRTIVFQKVEPNAFPILHAHQPLFLLLRFFATFFVNFPSRTTSFLSLPRFCFRFFASHLGVQLAIREDEWTLYLICDRIRST